MFWSLTFHFVFSPSVILVKVSSDMVDYKFIFGIKRDAARRLDCIIPKLLLFDRLI